MRSVLARLELASRQSDRYRWCALAITTFCQGAAVSLTVAIGPLAPVIQDDFQISRAEIGLALTVMALSSAGVALVAGRAADLIGERRVLVLSGLVAGFAALAVALADSFWAFLAAGFVLGFGSGVQNPAGSAAIMRWFPPRQRGLAMGIRQTGVPLGGILAAMAWPAVALALGWRMSYVLGGCVTLLGSLLIFVGYFDPVRGPAGARAGPLPLGRLLAHRQVWWFGLIYNAQIIAQYGAVTYFVLFLHEVLEVPLVAASALFAIINVVAIGGRIGWGILSDWQFRGERRPVLILILALTLVSVLVAAALPARAPLPFAVVLAALLGVSAFAWTGIYGTIVIESIGRESAASAIAMVTVLGSPGMLLGPPIFGWLVDRTGGYTVAWLAVAAAVCLGLVAVRSVTERPPSG